MEKTIKPRLHLQCSHFKCLNNFWGHVLIIPVLSLSIDGNRDANPFDPSFLSIYINSYEPTVLRYSLLDLTWNYDFDFASAKPIGHNFNKAELLSIMLIFCTSILYRKMWHLLRGHFVCRFTIEKQFLHGSRKTNRIFLE